MLPLKQKIFQRELESSFYSGREFKLPEYEEIRPDEADDFKYKFPLRFFNNENEFMQIREALNERVETEKIINAADDLLKNKFITCSGRKIDLKETIKWNYDYEGSYEFKKGLGWKQKPENVPKGVEPHFPWQLGRFHHSLILGQAYIISGEEKYAEKFLELFGSFNQENPFGTGIHWSCTAETAIRLLNMITSFALFAPSEKIDADFINAFIKTMYRHSVFIEYNYGQDSKNIKRIVSLAGLLAAGRALDGTNYGEKIFTEARSGLEKGIRTLTAKDGMLMDNSAADHFIALDAFTLGKLYLDRSEGKASKEYNNILYKMYTRLGELVRDDNTIPNTGDTLVSGILPFNYHERLYDPFAMLATGAYMFNDLALKKYDKKYTAGLFLFFGPNAAEKYERIVEMRNGYGFTDSTDHSFFVYRTEQLHLYMNVSGLAHKSTVGRTHGDTFSFELYYKNKPFIVDPGTYSLYADKDLLDKLRSTSSHNTFYVDNPQVTEFKSIFGRTKDTAKPKVIEYEDNNQESILVAQHYAFVRLTDPVVSKRTFHLFKETNKLKIKDEFFGGARHKIFSNLLIHPDVRIETLSNRSFRLTNDTTEMIINFYLTGEYYKISIQDAVYSGSYGNLSRTNKINLALNEKLPAFYMIEVELL